MPGGGVKPAPGPPSSADSVGTLPGTVSIMLSVEPNVPTPVAVTELCHARLSECGSPPTGQRVRIASLLLCAPQHLSAEQILATLRSSGARVSKATVYNTLNLFAARGIIR